VIGGNPPNLFDIPYMMPVTETHIRRIALQSWIKGRARFRVALICKFAVAMDHMMAASLKFCCNRCLADTGDTLDQVVSDTHGASIDSPALAGDA